MAQEHADTEDERGDEIIALLHQVGQRLIRNEQDRKQLKEVITDLEERADQGERAFLTVQDRISKTEAIIEKRQRAIEKTQKEQMARIEKAAAMADKIEEAIAQYSRINRRLDKAAQDKARIVRKLERIEETVIETQDALHAQPAVPTPLAATAANDDKSEDAPWWRQHGPVRAAAIVTMVFLGICGGWIVSNVELDRSTSRLAQFTPAERAAPVTLADNETVKESTPSPAFDAMADFDAPEKTMRFTAAVDEAVEKQAPKAKAEKNAPVQETEPVTASPQKEEPRDPIEMADEELLASLNEDPEALAGELNEIATGAGQTAVPDQPEDVAPAATAQPKAEQVAYTPHKPAREMTTAEFIAGQKDSRPLRERIKPDPSLPDVIKEVEQKAFEGIAEAQHDLAAIYTAGHGGVKIDYERAATWFRESAVRGIANARYNLGVLYHQGLGVENDINMAVAWYRAAAESGHPEAQYNLGIAYIEGIGARYNPEKAAYYFEKAAKGGILEAAYNLGLIHENGLTGRSQPDEALYWYKKAADQGSPEAQTAINQLAKTLGLVPEDIERMYSERNEAQEESSAADSIQPKAAKPQKQTSNTVSDPGNDKGFEYIEAQPLDSSTGTTSSESKMAALPVIEDNGQELMHAQDHAIIAQIQEQLMRLGLYPGPADGVNDSLTEDAIRSYQAHNNLREDGRASQALLVHMMTSEMGSNETNIDVGSRAE